MRNIKKTLCVLSLGVLLSTAVSCNKTPKGPTVEETIQSAIEKVILTQNNTDVTTNFTVAAFVKYEGVKYDITWTSSNSAAQVLPNSETLKTINITRPEAGQEDAEVTLTAKISAVEGESTYYATKDFKFVVPALEATPSCESIAALKEAINTGATSSSNAYTTNFGSKELTVVGILTGKGVIIADETDVIYLFGTSYATALKVGDNITISECSAYRYYGCPEIVDATYTKVSSGNANPCAAKKDVTIQDVRSALTSANFVANDVNSSLFTYISVQVKVLNIVDGTKSYIVLADPTDPDDTSKWMMVYNYNVDYAEFEKVVGATVTVNVNIHDVYSNFDFGGTIGKVTVLRVNYFDGPISAELTDEQKAANVATDALKGIATEYSRSAEVTLSDTVTWSLNAEANASVFALSGNTLTITPTKTEEKATLTASATVGSAVVTKSVELTAKVPDAAPLAAPVTYDFSNNENTSPLDATSLVEFFKTNVAGGATNIVDSAKDVSKVYGGNPEQGPKVKGLKTGTGSANGSFTLELSASVIKVKVVCYAWSATSGDTVSVNGCEAQAAGAGEAKELTFELTERTPELVFNFAKRVVITSITFE